MNHNLQLHNDIMMRVRTLNFVELVLTSPVIILVLIISLFVWVDVLISFTDIIRNTLAHGSLASCLSYIYTSFIKSRFIVQFLGATIILTGLTLLTSAFRRVRKEGFVGLYNFSWRV